MLAFRRCQYVREVEFAGLSLSTAFEKPNSQSKISKIHRPNNLVELMITEIEVKTKDLGGVMSLLNLSRHYS